jgi:hypothetical protein
LFEKTFVIRVQLARLFNCSAGESGIECATYCTKFSIRRIDMKARTIVRVSALTISLDFAGVAMAFQTNPNMGTWKLNEAKSKFAGKARNHTVVYEATGDQTKVTVDGVDESGNAVHSEWTGKFDGKDYPVTGEANSDVRSYRMVNKSTLAITGKKGGKVTLSGRIVVSRDGKTRTVTTTATNAQGKKVTNVAVYDKQ